MDPDDLADMLTAIFEGAFILSKALAEPETVARQLAQYRTFLEVLFEVEPS